MAISFVLSPMEPLRDAKPIDTKPRQPASPKLIQSQDYTPCAMIDSKTSPIRMILSKIQNRQWDQVHFLLNHPRLPIWEQELHENKDFHQMTILHAICRFQPPPVILDLAIRKSSRSTHSLDVLGRTPLHVAAGCCASYDILAILVYAYAGACAIQDIDGKTPLIIACDTSCELYERNLYPTRLHPSVDTIKLFVCASPETVVLEDIDDTGALEYAIMSDCNLKAIKLLQRACHHVMSTSQTRPSTSMMFKPRFQ